MADLAEIGVFGGSGFYTLLEDVREAKIDTPYGQPSDSVFLATISGRKVAFLPRHGRPHTIPPHKINYRANVWAMRSLGVRRHRPCAGSLTAQSSPALRVSDQFVDRTNGRPHLLRRPDRLASPPRSRPVLRRALTSSASRDHSPRRRHVVVIQGPRFSTRVRVKVVHHARAGRSSIR